MEQITLQFANKINVSLQQNVGDIVYFKTINNAVLKIGKCIAVDEYSLTCEIESSYKRPSANDFIFFAKDTNMNTSGIIGYYANATFEITSQERKELFATNAEVFISS